MSPINVPALWFKIKLVKFSKYVHHGKFLVAWHPKQVRAVIETKLAYYTYRQIAGALAEEL
jgi:hypothetical protein